jgi:hypothetical protein
MVLGVCFTNGEWYAAAVMTKQSTALISNADRIASSFHNMILIQLGFNSLHNTQHTNLIITSTHHVQKKKSTFDSNNGR